MRIAYVANYQGPALVEQRPIVRNLSMSNRVKMELVATLLHRESHDVTVVSQGEVVDHRLTLYPRLTEPVRFHEQISVEYASCLPVKRLNGAWSSLNTVRLLRSLHRRNPFDLVIVFNLKWPQIAAAQWAMRTLRIPVVLQYEDDAFRSVHDERESPLAGAYTAACRRILQTVSGCIAVSPYLASQLPDATPRMLLRGVVAPDLVEAESLTRGQKQNRVVFAGTHIESNGVAELIEGWKRLAPPGWELHITGNGQLTPALQASAAGVPSIVFHGLVSREELVQVLSSAKICINPHKVADRPGVVFAFKLIEYLAVGAHVITTPMGDLERDLEHGITYLPDNSPTSIATTLAAVINNGLHQKTAGPAAQRSYGLASVAQALRGLLVDATADSRGSSLKPVQCS